MPKTLYSADDAFQSQAVNMLGAQVTTLAISTSIRMLRLGALMRHFALERQYDRPVY